MTWRSLRQAPADAPAKLFWLAHGSRHGLRVPPTVWAPADAAPFGAPPPEIGSGPWIVRSAAIDEDTHEGTAAGRYESVAVERAADLPAAIDTVRRSFQGRGAVLLQPLLAPERGGVAFTDGFHFERTEAAGGNRSLTAGTERGDLVRGHLVRGEAWSAFVERLARVYAPNFGDAGIDVEYAVV
ncbi:MAG: hypothetical protein AAFZ65_16575, partial [Planctomycetota bacterium]